MNPSSAVAYSRASLLCAKASVLFPFSIAAAARPRILLAAPLDLGSRSSSVMLASLMNSEISLAFSMSSFVAFPSSIFFFSLESSSSMSSSIFLSSWLTPVIFASCAPSSAAEKMFWMKACAAAAGSLAACSIARLKGTLFEALCPSALNVSRMSFSAWRIEGSSDPRAGPMRMYASETCSRAFWYCRADWFPEP